MKKRYGKRTGKVNKGAPSGFIISLLLHAAAFSVAGAFVVFTVMKPKAPEFVVPPPMERPKMNLKKPIVKVKRSSSPAPSSRIVAKVKMAKMPEISIPDLTGTGDALMSGMGGMGSSSFGLEPGGTYLFGDTVTTGNDLEVTFYSLGRTRSGAKRQISEMEYFDIIRRFVEGGFDTGILKNYYRSTGKLYAQCVAIPKVMSIAGPLSFGESDYLANSSRWAAHYKGNMKHKDGVTFRFWGASDDVLNVAINGEVVLAANLAWRDMSANKICEFFQGSAPGSRTIQSAEDGRYWICDTRSQRLMGSDWITLEPGKEYDFDAVAGEGPGGEFFAVLMVEIQGEYYEKNDRGQPIWPLFATAPLSWDAQDSIMLNMIEDDYNVTSITNYFVVE